MHTKFMKSAFFVTLLFLILFNGCKNKPSAAEAEQSQKINDTIASSGRKFKGNWLCKDYLDALRLRRNADNIELVTQKPDVWELIFDDDTADSVVIYSDGSRQHLPVKRQGDDSVSVTLRNGRKILFTYDKYLDHLVQKNESSEKKVKPDCVYEKANVKYLYLDAGIKTAFSQAVNENTLANDYKAIDKNNKISDQTVYLRFDGSISGLDDFEKYAVCYALPCTQLLKGKLQNVVYLTSKRKTEPYAWKISGNYDTLYIYSISENKTANQLKYKLLAVKD